jgi:hypothetical protein
MAHIARARANRTSNKAREERTNDRFRQGEPMATILEFRSHTMREPAQHHAGGSAEIVLFPGVRYERWAEDSQPKPKAKKGRRRDMLELED